MHATWLPLAAAALLAFGPPPPPQTPRKPNPFAPSLPLLTDEEEAKLDDVIDRFIRTDAGLVRDEAARQAARRAFDALGPEAILALIRGLNRAAKIEHSCPAVVIAKKLTRMLRASDDAELLQYARDEVGAGAGRTRHAPVLQELRLTCMVRRNEVLRNPELARRPAPAPAPEPAGSTSALTTAQLAERANTERGAAALRPVLTELERRRGPEVLAGLALAAASYDRDTRQLGRDLLDRHLGRQDEAFVKARLKDDQPEVRKAAARAAAAKFPSLGGEVIALLADDDAGVRGEAHEALVRLARGEDFGPPADADAARRDEAQRKWRAWWDRRGGR
jgi:hypothetical protein